MGRKEESLTNEMCMLEMQKRRAGKMGRVEIVLLPGSCLALFSETTKAIVLNVMQIGTAVRSSRTGLARRFLLWKIAFLNSFMRVM